MLLTIKFNTTSKEPDSGTTEYVYNAEYIPNIGEYISNPQDWMQFYEVYQKEAYIIRTDQPHIIIKAKPYGAI